MHGVILNNVHVPKHQQIPIHHMDTVAFSSVSRFLYSFQHAPKVEMIEEPHSKKLCLNPNSPVALQTSVCSTTSLERTVKNKTINTQLATKSQEAKDNNRKKKVVKSIHFQDYQIIKIFTSCSLIQQTDYLEKTKEIEERIARINEENQVLIEQNESIVHKSTMEIDILQVKILPSVVS
jgi:hypothetical protein